MGLQAEMLAGKGELLPRNGGDDIKPASASAEDEAGDVSTSLKRRRIDAETGEEISETHQGAGETAEADGYGSGALTRGRHPYGVKPQGNFFSDIEKGIRPIRSRGLGNLSCLDDSRILELLDYLTSMEVAVLSLISKTLYVFAHHDELWKARVLLEFDGRFDFLDNWRTTYILMDLRRKGIRNPGHTHRPIVVDGFYSDLLFQPFWCASAPLKTEWVTGVENVDRKSNLSYEEFVEAYEKPNKPVIITDVVRKWPAFSLWKDSYLVETAGENVFSAGGFKMTFQDYFQYCKFSGSDDQPLYIFDKSFAKNVPQLAADYSVPKYFDEDLFRVLGDNRPDYRWLIVGPAKSGSSFHQDPNSTSAWNAVIRGAKKWILYPPEVCPPGVHPTADGADVATPVSLMEWFVNFYHETKKGAIRPLECVVREGEMIFVPRGWWHAVINIEDSIAITQNYVSSCNLTYVLEFLDKRQEQISGVSDPEFKARFGEEFKKRLRESGRPDVVALVDDYEKRCKERQKPAMTLWETIKADDALTNESGGGFSFGFQWDS